MSLRIRYARLCVRAEFHVCVVVFVRVDVRVSHPWPRRSLTMVRDAGENPVSFRKLASKERLQIHGLFTA